MRKNELNQKLVQDKINYQEVEIKMKEISERYPESEFNGYYHDSAMSYSVYLWIKALQDENKDLDADNEFKDEQLIDHNLKIIELEKKLTTFRKECPSEDCND
jgi:hypothetical protein